MAASGVSDSRRTPLILPLVLLAFLWAIIPVQAQSAPAAPDGARVRVRDLGVAPSEFPTGKLNAITDVAGVRVGHVTLMRGSGKLVPGQGPVRTGATVIIPREDVWHKKVPAGGFVLNGTGEMTGLAWVEESGFLEYPVVLTNTLNLPRAANGLMSWMIARYPGIGITDDTLTPVVAECDDSRLNDMQGRHVSEAEVMQALDQASSGPVAEGTVGAGTGMISYGFKGGIGTASRLVALKTGETYTVGVLVNANHGQRSELMMDGIAVGKLYGEPGTDGPEGSIIIVIGTDTPLDARQLKRLAKRAALGLARTGSTVRHGSGDFVLAFSTGSVIPHYPERATYLITAFADTHLNPLFTATVEATTEAILNAITMATTVVGRDDQKAEAIDLGRLRNILKTHRR